MAPCNAPFNNMYFTVQGYVSPCWKLPGFVDSWSSFRSISDIWFGKEFGRYRDALKQNIFLDACKDCEKNIKDGVWPLAKAYEEYPKTSSLYHADNREESQKPFHTTKRPSHKYPPY